MRAKDWSASPLGYPETWPQSVKTAVSICLNSRVPIALWLGPELRLIYNDTYIPFLGETKHPAMLGAPGREAWGEIWAAIEPMHDEVAAGRATSVEDVQLFFTRRLPREEVYVSWGYSPILAADGARSGTFDACPDDRSRWDGGSRHYAISAPVRQNSGVPRSLAGMRPRFCAPIRWIFHLRQSTCSTKRE